MAIMLQIYLYIGVYIKNINSLYIYSIFSYYFGKNIDVYKHKHKHHYHTRLKHEVNLYTGQ